MDFCFSKYCQTKIKNKLKKENPPPTNEDYACLICGITKEGMRKKGYVTRQLTFCCDHDWKTGKFRGYICQKCNTGIGNLQDDPEIIRKALEYITNDKN